METEASKMRKRENAQEAFKRLREKSKVEMLDRMHQIEDAQERAIEAKTDKIRKQGKDVDESNRKGSRMIEPKTIQPTKDRKPQIPDKLHDNSPPRPINVMTQFPPNHESTKPEHHGEADITRIGAMMMRHRKRRGKCGNCCGGLPGKGPSRDGCAGSCCCSSGNRQRGGSDTDRWLDENSLRIEKARSSSENSRVSQRLYDHCQGPASMIFQIVKDESNFHNGGQNPSWPLDSFPLRENRVRGGCGSCRATPPKSCIRPCPPSPVPQCQRQREFPCQQTSRPKTTTNACCPCGGCGGAACSDNPGGGGIEAGCCGGNPPRGLPCRCKCQSCDTFRPLGGCGGQSCGRIYSCAGSGGGRCCFPRNYKRRAGTECCGGANSNCGGCC